MKSTEFEKELAQTSIERVEQKEIEQNFEEPLGDEIDPEVIRGRVEETREMINESTVGKRKDDLHFKNKEVLVGMLRNKEYYSNSGYVRSDLETFVKALSIIDGNKKSVFDLNTSNIASLNIKLANNESDINGYDYLSRAAISFGLSKTIRESTKHFVYVLDYLLKIAGFTLRDIDYYKNIHFIKQDLGRYAEQLSKGKKRIQVRDLKVTDIQSLLITCSNNEPDVSGDRYLKHAAIALGLANNHKTASLKRTKVLKILLTSLGIETPEYPPLNEQYYSNPEFVKSDLETYAKKLSARKKEQLTVLDLNTSNIASIPIRLSSGEPSIVGNKYLKHAAIAFGLAKNTRQAVSKQLKALHILLKIAGFEVNEYDERNEKYYLNANNLKKDLEAFAKELSKKKGEEVTILELNSSNIKSLKITGANNELNISGGMYLNSAAISLGYAKNTIQANRVHKEIFSLLLVNAGFEVEQYPSRDEQYYSNSKFIKQDLNAYAQALFLESGNKVEVSALKPGNILALSIKTSNGEPEIKGQRYLNNAAIALGFARDYKDAPSKHTETLKALLKKAGFTVPEYLSRDILYYRNSKYVKRDLKAYAKKLSIERKKTVVLSDLKAGNIYSLTITGSNNEPNISGTRYLKHAAISLGLAKDSNEAHTKQTAALEILLQTIGVEITKYSPRDNKYYTNSHNVERDLINYARELSNMNNIQMTVFDLNTSNLDSLFITCSNNEPSVKGRKYLLNAAVALGIAENTSQAALKPLVTLKKLFEIAGFEITEYPKRDSVYYNNSKYVKCDLEEYAYALSKKLQRNISVTELKATYIKDIKITTSNNEPDITGNTYINNAGIALGIAKNVRESRSKHGTIFKTLLQIAKYKIDDFLPLNAEYYTEPSYIKEDLETFTEELSKKLKKNITVLELTSGSISSLSIAAANGEPNVKGQRYLINAAIAYGLANNTRDASPKQPEALKLLKKIAGFQTDEEKLTQTILDVLPDEDTIRGLEGMQGFTENDIVNLLFLRFPHLRSNETTILHILDEIRGKGEDKKAPQVTSYHMNLEKLLATKEAREYFVKFMYDKFIFTVRYEEDGLNKLIDEISEIQGREDTHDSFVEVFDDLVELLVRIDQQEYHFENAEIQPLNFIQKEALYWGKRHNMLVAIPVAGGKSYILQSLKYALENKFNRPNRALGITTNNMLDDFGKKIAHMLGLVENPDELTPEEEASLHKREGIFDELNQMGTLICHDPSKLAEDWQEKYGMIMINQAKINRVQKTNGNGSGTLVLETNDSNDDEEEAAISSGENIADDTEENGDTNTVEITPNSLLPFEERMGRYLKKVWEYNPEVTLLDESHMIKNLNSVTLDVLLRLVCEYDETTGRFKDKRFMQVTATPMLSNVKDFVTQLMLTNPNEVFNLMDEQEQKILADADDKQEKIIEIFKSKMRSINQMILWNPSFVRNLMRKHVLFDPMPDFDIFEDVEAVTLSAETQDYIKGITEGSVTEDLLSFKNSQTTNSKRIEINKLLLRVGGEKYENVVESLEGQPRVCITTDNLISGFTRKNAAGESWTDALQNNLKVKELGYEILVLDGEVDKEDRLKRVDKWRNGDGKYILLANQTVINYGQNLTCGDLPVDLTMVHQAWTAGHIVQLKGRFDRDSQRAEFKTKLLLGDCLPDVAKASYAQKNYEVIKCILEGRPLPEDLKKFLNNKTLSDTMKSDFQRLMNVYYRRQLPHNLKGSFKEFLEDMQVFDPVDGMNDIGKIQAFYSKVMHSLESVQDYPFTGACYDLVQEMIEDDFEGKVLDIGAGVGVTEQITKMLEEDTDIALNIDFVNLDMISHLLDTQNSVTATMSALPFKDAVFDRAIANFSFDLMCLKTKEGAFKLVKKSKEALLRAVETIKPGGDIIYTMPLTTGAKAEERFNQFAENVQEYIDSSEYLQDNVEIESVKVELREREEKKYTYGKLVLRKKTE